MSRVFVNTSDHLDLSSPSVLDTPFTMSIWVKWTSLSNNIVMSIGTSATATNTFNLRIATAAFVQAEIVDSTSSTANTAQKIVADAMTWRLYVGVFTSHSAWASFIDGTGKGTASASKTPSGMNVFRISGDCNTTPGSSLNGKLAHAAIWNIALSDPQVASLLYLYPNQVAVANLVNYWPLTNNQSPEPDFGSGNLPLTVTGTTFSTDNPNIAGTQVIQLMGQAG